ncbi:exported hypothetical protein [uncultured Gammaproteobacteria bacterium]
MAGNRHWKQISRLRALAILVLATVAAVTGAAAQAWPEPARILGMWRSAGPVIDNGLHKMYLAMAIGTGSVTFRYDCRYLDGTVLTGNLTARAEVSPTAIRILERSQSHVGTADSDCAVSIAPTALPYRVTGDTMTVTFKDKPVAMLRPGR